jgi:5-methylcytosine-specific restriction protein A
MAGRAFTPCPVPGCGALVLGGGRCGDHRVEDVKAVRERRNDWRKRNPQPSRHERGYTNKWHAARTAFLLRHPLCKHCADAGRLTPANVVDHIIDHKGDAQLFWDFGNWQALCASCHNRKTWSTNGVNRP